MTPDHLLIALLIALIITTCIQSARAGYWRAKAIARKYLSDDLMEDVNWLRDEHRKLTKALAETRESQIKWLRDKSNHIS